MIKALAYTRVSGRGQLNGHGLERQHDVIMKFGAKAGFQVLKAFDEKAISGTIDESNRPAFQEMITYMIHSEINHVIIESLDRLARDLQIQLQLCTYLASKKIYLISASTEENITEAILTDPLRKALVQIQGVFAELDKSLVVRKLKIGRDKARKVSQSRTLLGENKCEGRKSLRETNPELLVMAKKLYRKPPNGTRRSLRNISILLSRAGYTTSKGRTFEATQIKRILGV